MLNITKFNYLAVIILFIKFITGFDSPIVVKIKDRNVFQHSWYASRLALGDCDVRKHNTIFNINFLNIGKPFKIYWK